MFDGQMHGVGRLTYENNEHYNGDFVRGIISQRLLQFSAEWRSLFLLVDWLLWDMINLSCIHIYSKIELSLHIVEGKRHGLGQYVYADGSIFKGMSNCTQIVFLFSMRESLILQFFLSSLIITFIKWLIDSTYLVLNVELSLLFDNIMFTIGHFPSLPSSYLHHITSVFISLSFS